MSEIDRLYTDAANGLKKTDDAFVKMTTGDQFSRLVKGMDPLIERANIIKMHALDYTVYGEQVKPVIDEEGIKLAITQDESTKEYKLTDWSLGQFCAQLKIPVAYALDMIKAGKHKLFIENFQSWINSHAAGKQFFMRTIDNKLRGVLSDRYQPIDADYMLPKLRHKLGLTDMGFYVDKAVLNPEYTNVRIISDRKIAIAGDPHFIGMRYATSDVGRASFSYELFMFRSRCTNGMFFGRKDFNAINHMHTVKEFFKEGYFEAEMDQVIGSVEPMVRKVSKALEVSQGQRLDDKTINRILEQFHSRTRFNKNEVMPLREEILTAAADYATAPTLWSLTNGFTEAAQNQRDPQRAEQMERFSGELLLGFAKMV